MGRRRVSDHMKRIGPIPGLVEFEAGDVASTAVAHNLLREFESRGSRKKIDRVGRPREFRVLERGPG